MYREHLHEDNELDTATYPTMTYIEGDLIRVYTTHPWRLGALAP
jgi:hypothetical protein